MVRANEDIRRAMGANGLKQWQIAQAIGMRDENFSRKLRTELSNAEKEKILSVIDGMAKEAQNGN